MRVCNNTNLILATVSARHFVHKKLIQCVGPMLNISIIAFTNAAQLQITKLQT